MGQRPTIRDLARAAGVGTATADRALHGRGNVSDRMRQRIAEAAERIGYRLPSDTTAPSAPLRRINLGFVLHKPSQSFYQRFATEIEAACAAHPAANITPHIEYSASQSPDDFCAAITRAAQNTRAVAATAINHPSLSRLVTELQAQGTPIYSLLNDFGGRAGAGYFGLDNMKVGRIAGWMMALRLQRPGRVGIFVGGTRWHGHSLRETGFRNALHEYAPQIAIADTVVNLETRQVTYEATLDLLSRHSDLAGLYVAGGGMEGAIAALREVRPPNKVALIVNELTPESQNALADRYALMCVATPLKELCAALVDSMAQAPDLEVSSPTLFEPNLLLPESF
ncbi:LacI family DNA-binding transcriptional regulator [Vannielia litorea]|uniref:LacI family DNA-binding transcriptional regulator n=1 Tax=Vannielia litorea TaxID=1217970 RepID=UPI001C98D8C0|nr:LacI family DNA-binding transcriptional regulator [Vannielia litorea]MBY6154425.1 LacI family DNA-binding transcriptional regulator [Vannielia litorea]